jgi:hypothetical protein
MCQRLLCYIAVNLRIPRLYWTSLVLFDFSTLTATTSWHVIQIRYFHFYLGEYRLTSENPYFYLWVLSSILSSCYAYTWDIKMDWGLFDKKAGDNKYLREEIVYSSTVSYVHLPAYMCMNFRDTLFSLNLAVSNSFFFIYYYYYLLQLGLHLVAVVLT